MSDFLEGMGEIEKEGDERGPSCCAAPALWRLAFNPSMDLQQLQKELLRDFCKAAAAASPSLKSGLRKNRLCDLIKGQAGRRPAAQCFLFLCKPAVQGGSVKWTALARSV